MTELRIRTMTRADLALALGWAAGEGWNPGLTDSDSFYAADPSGFFIGEIDGKPVASLSAIAYGDDFGFLGLYIVRPEWRGQGHGIALWRHGMAYLGPRRNVGLDGVVAQQDNYRKSGFTWVHRNIRFEAPLIETTPHDVKHGVIEPVAGLPFAELEAYDRRFFPATRRGFLERWIAGTGTHALALIRNGTLAGYGCIRPARAGHKIGPLFANDEQAAETLFHALARHVSVGPVILDVPQPNRAAVAMAERHGMKPSFETARMYTKGAPAIDLGGLYGITSFELG